MLNIDEVLDIADKEVANITRCDDPQAFVNKCLGTEFTDCAESLRWYKRNDSIYNAPKRGDQVFVGNCTGIVEMVVGNTVYTIEADNDVDSSFYGLICRKKRNIDDCVYGRPTYESSKLITGPKTVDEIKQWLQNIGIFGDISEGIIKAAQASIGVYPDGDLNAINNAWKAVKRGHLGMQAQVVQVALICAGYSCGEYGANGYFGEDSVDAVKMFQRNNKMVRDGIAGKAVAMKLFKGVTL